jgi:hypothetical protein
MAFAAATRALSFSTCRQKVAAAAVAGKIAAAMAGGSGDDGRGGATVLPLRSGA